ncbi:MAG: hypothetical protein ACTSPD_10205 [Promethearchaeota archaeon]
MINITETKHIIRPTLYWELRRIRRKLYLLKQTIIQELGINRFCKYLLNKFL